MIFTFKSEEYGWLSNMVSCQIHMKGRFFNSVEHAYVSEKRGDDDWRDFCANQGFHPNRYSSHQIKNKGQDIIIRPDWDDVKLLVMEHCLCQKFKHEPFKTMLIATGDQNIQEGNYWGDAYWGIDLKQNPNVGENHLGRLIMKIRDELQR